MNNFYYPIILSLTLLLSTGCSNITNQARLDRFNEKLKTKEIKLSNKLNKDLTLRENNTESIKKDIEYLKSKINSTKSNQNSKIKDSFKRYEKSLETQGEVQLIHYEIKMLQNLEKKESKLNTIKNNINKISSTEEQKVIKSLKKKKYELTEKMNDLYIDISWFESVNRINLINAQKSTLLINESNIYAREGNFSKAISSVQKASKLTPRIPIIYAQLGSLYYLTGDNKSSLYYYKKVTEFDNSISGIEEMITLLENKSIVP